MQARAAEAEGTALKGAGPGSGQLNIKELAGESGPRCQGAKAPGNDQSFGGIKVETESGWFAARPSGTEDVYKIYAESFRDKNHLSQIQREAQSALARVFD